MRVLRLIVAVATFALAMPVAHAERARSRILGGRASLALFPGFLKTLHADHQWWPNGCTTAPYALPGMVGGVNIPESATNTAHTCNSTTESDAGTELIGSGAGLYPQGIGSLLKNRGISMAGGANWINTTASAIPAVTNQEQALCMLFRPRGTPDYLINIQSTSVEFIRMRFSANSFITETRCDGSSVQVLNQAVALGPLNQIHFGCWRLFDVCEVQAAGRGCMSSTMDGVLLNGSEFATDINSYGASTSITIGSDSLEANRFDGEIFWIGYWRTTANTTADFGTTRAQFQAGSRTIIQKLGIGSGAGSPVAPNRRVIMVLAAGQSPMVGFGATPTLTTTNQIPHREGLGATNALPLLREGTGTGASESRGSALCNELAARDPNIQCVWVERAVSDTSITTWDDGDANFESLQTWFTNALDYGCGKWDTITVYVVWHQGETDLPDLATWNTNLGTIQDSLDTLIRARGCVNNVEVKMLIGQTSTYTHYGFTTADLVTERQYPAGTSDFAGRIYLAGPAYHVPYQADGLHPTNVGEQRLGIDMGRALYRLDASGSFDGVRVTAVNVAGSVVTVDFATPYPPLITSCSTGNPDGVTDPANSGFEWSDANARTISSIGSVTCDSGTGPTTCHVPITLSGAPGGSRVLGVGRTGSIGCGGGNCPAGPTTGARSCIHDSATSAWTGASAPNWAVHQRFSVP